MGHGLTKKLDKSVIGEVRKLDQAKKILRGSVPGSALKFLHLQADLLMKELVHPTFGRTDIVVAVAIDKFNRKRLAQYHPDRDGLGLRWRVDVNAVHLGNPRADIVRSLLHEILHALQDDHGDAAKGNYHNEEFQAWSWWLGIPCDDGGHDCGTEPNSAFSDYCQRNGLGDGKLVDREEKKKLPKAKGSPLKKWSCSCGVNARVATFFDATCNLCGSKFELQGEPEGE